jgi:hypothetical protein
MVRSDVLMDPAPISLVVASELPVWAAITIALITAILGLVAGAAAAAVVTTTHERAKDFRTRLVEALTDVVEVFNRSAETLSRAFDTSEFTIYDTYDYAAIRRACAKTEQMLSEAQKPIALLWALAPTSDVGSLASLRANELNYFAARLRLMTNRHEVLREQLAVADVRREDSDDEGRAEIDQEIAHWNQEILDDYQSLSRDKPHVGEVFGFLTEARKQIRRRFL